MIARVDLYRADLSQDETAVLSQANFATCEEVYLKLTTEDGQMGFGEVRGNLHYVFGSTTESVISIVRDHMSKLILRRDPLGIGVINRNIAKEIVGNSAAKALFDTALHDLVCRMLNIPVFTFLGGKTSTENSLPTHVDVYVSTVEKSKKDAIRFVEAGFEALKMRVGTGLSLDIARLKAVREAVGSEIEISLDANGAWSEKKAIKSIKSMERYDPEYVEQPVQAWNIRGLKNVKKRVDTPIVADESAQSHEQIINLISDDAADIFHLKIAKLGGILNTMKAIATIEASGKLYVMGQMNEGGLATAAAVHCAAASHPSYCELEMPFRIPKDVTPGMEVKNGKVNIPTGPGLGVQPNEQLLTLRATSKA